MRCFCMLLLTSVWMHAAEVNFFSPQTIANGSPISVAQADFNHDGRPDLVVAGFPESGPSAVYLYVGLGNGQFSHPYLLLGADWLWQVAIGDFNNDGNQDIAILIAPNGSPTATLAILLGDGHGAFNQPVYTSVAAGSQHMILGDFNGDNNLDVALATPTAQIQVMLGTGNGNFTGPVATTLSGSADSLAVADFNRDGKLDLAVDMPATFPMSGGTVAILLGNGDGSFQPPSTLSLTPGSFVLAAGDVNDDHIPDLIAGDRGASTVEILFGKGDGTFSIPIVQGLSRFPSSVLIGDVNGDGRPDIVVGCSDYGQTDGGEVAVLINIGNGMFQVPIVSDLGIDAITLVVGDYNQDGRLDVAFTSDFTVMIAPGDGKGRFLQPSDYITGKYGSGIATGDFRGAGTIDIAATNENGFAFLPGKGNGLFGAAQLFTQMGFFATLAAAGDFNRDGITDLLLVGSTGVFGGAPDGMQVWLGGSAGLKPGPAASTPLPFDISAIATGRFRTGGNLDLAFSFRGSANHSGGVGVFPGDGNGSFQKPTTFFLTFDALAVTVGDFNLDGKLDLAASSGSQAVILLGNGDGTFQAPLFLPVANDQFQSMASADVNGDGKPDLVLAGFLYNQVYVLLGNGDGTFQATQMFPTGKAPYSLVIQDFNCDGKLDLATANYNANGVSILLGNGDGTFQPAANFAAGNFPRGLAAGDFTGSGKQSLAVANSNSSFASVLLNVTPGACR